MSSLSLATLPRGGKGKNRTKTTTTTTINAALSFKSLLNEPIIFSIATKTHNSGSGISHKELKWCVIKCTDVAHFGKHYLLFLWDVHLAKAIFYHLGTENDKTGSILPYAMVERVYRLLHEHSPSNLHSIPLVRPCGKLHNLLTLY